MGINTGLRISDLLKLKIIDIKGKSHVEIKEQKTAKIKRFPLLGNLQSMVDEYIKGKSDNDYERPLATTITNNSMILHFAISA